MNRLRFAVCTIWLLPLAGCGDGMVDVQAKVLLDGQPLEGASVTLMGSGEQGSRPASGESDAEGVVRHFTTLKPGDGVNPGHYSVLVNKSPQSAPKEIPRMDPNDPAALRKFQEATRGSANLAYTPTALPRVYLSRERTPLKCTVEPDMEPLVFELSSSAGDD